MMPQLPPGFELIPDVPPPPPGFEPITQPGLVANYKEMATEGAGQMARGVGQLHNAWDFARSGAGKNVVVDTPANRVAGGFSALDKDGPQAPLTTTEHQAANRQAVGDAVKGFGNVVSGTMGAAYAPLNAALKTYVGQPVEQATGSKGAGIAAELVAGVAAPSVLARAAGSVGRKIASKPTPEAIKEAGAAGFSSPVVRGLEIKPQPVEAWSNNLRTRLSDDGLSDVTAKDTWKILGRLDGAPTGATVTGNNLQGLRRELQEVAGQRGPDFQATSDAKAATKAIDELDKLIASGISKNDVVKGDPAAAARVWEEARANWSQYAKMRAADKRQMLADTQATGAHSGRNFDNNMRQKMRDIIAGPAGRGFTGPGEREAVERIGQGSPERNATRTIANLLGGGGGLGASTVGSLAAIGTSNPWMLATIPVGMGAKGLQNAATRRDLDRLNEVLRANSPLASQQGGARQDIARALMGVQVPERARNAIAAQLLSRLPPLPGP
jgi:hypothetical protein